MAEVQNEDVNIRHAKVELVRNPYIALYLNSKPKEELEKYSEGIFIPINQDELYNDKASLADSCYSYTNRIKEGTNMRYVRASSGIVPESYLDGLVDNGLDIEDDFILPYDYLLVTRTDGTQFLIAENYIRDLSKTDFHKYSIIRYVNPKELFREDNVYSNGIDISRLLSEDVNYVDTFANNFLSEKRLNESLMTVYSALDIQKADETDHGGQYVGYIDKDNLSIQTSMEKSELLLFEKKIREGGM